MIQLEEYKDKKMRNRHTAEKEYKRRKKNLSGDTENYQNKQINKNKLKLRSKSFYVILALI